MLNVVAKILKQFYASSDVKVDGVLLAEEKAVVIDRVAIISDLHLGIENVLAEKGIFVPRMQIDEIISQANKLVRKYKIDKLIIAGDLKHEFSKNLPYEWRDIEKFLNEVEARVEVVRGNHDNYLSAILSKFNVPLVDEIKIGDWKVVHGHFNCEGKKIIMGHEHPTVKSRIEGAIYTFPCFLRIAIDDRIVIVLPAFSPFLAGSNVLEIDSFLSPILSKVDLSSVEVYGIADEIYYLGRIGDLKSI